nr:transposase [Mycobacterium riyadhense]
MSIRAGVRHPVARFGVLCQSCPLRAQCTKSRRGRVISIHPREAALQHAKARQRDPAWQQDYRTYRPVVESFDFAEPALVLRFGDAGFEVVSDLNEPGALVGVGP